MKLAERGTHLLLKLNANLKIDFHDDQGDNIIWIKSGWAKKSGQDKQLLGVNFQPFIMHFARHHIYSPEP